MSEEKGYIYGKNSILESLNSQDGRLNKIFFCYGVQSSEISKIIAKARKQKIPCVQYDKRKFSELERKVCPKDSRSQGVIALRNLIAPLAISELIKKSEKVKNPIVVVLDGITDPHNLGAIARSVECAGAFGMVLPERNSAPITPVAIKASAGALEHLPVAYSTNLNLAIEKLKNAGFWVIGSSDKANKPYTDKIYNSPIAIIIGSEGAGMKPSTAKHCDFLVKIPLFGKINSLNASVAAGVMLFEAVRQRTLVQSMSNENEK